MSAYDKIIEYFGIDINTITVTDLLGFHNTTLVLPRRSSIAWEMVKICLSVLDKYDVEYCLYFGSLLGFLRCGHEEPYLDDWDIAVPDYPENISKISKAINEINQAKICSRINNRGAQGWQLFAAEWFGKSYGENGRNEMNCIAQLDIFYMHRNEYNNTIQWPHEKIKDKRVDRINGINCQFTKRAQGTPYSRVFPAIEVMIDGDSIKLPACSLQHEFYQFLLDNYPENDQYPENIAITSHFIGPIEGTGLWFDNNTSHTDVIKAFYIIEKKAKMNMEKLIKNEDPNQKIYIPQQTGYIMNINRELYIKQVPKILSYVDSIAKNNICKLPLDYSFYMSELILYRPNIEFQFEIFKKDTKINPDYYKAFFNLLKKHKRNYLPKEEDYINDTILQSPHERLNYIRKNGLARHTYGPHAKKPSINEVYRRFHLSYKNSSTKNVQKITSINYKNFSTKNRQGIPSINMQFGKLSF